MKKIAFILAALAYMAVIACNNSDDSKQEGVNDPKKTQADSLEKEVMEGHDAAMPKSTKIPKLQQEAKRLIDSIGKLPAKAQEAAAPLKTKLENLYNDLENAYTAMDKWMMEFRLDSAKDNTEKRIKYLTEEKLKVDNVKEAVLSSLAKADTVLKSRF